MKPRDARKVIWICTKCAHEHGATTREGHLATWHEDLCGVCNELKTVTEPRDFRWPQ